MTARKRKQRLPPSIGTAWWAAQNRIKRLREMWEAGILTAEKIAATLGTTKGAVIGQARRRGYRARRETTKPAAAAPKREPMSSGAGCAWPIGDPALPGFSFCGAHDVLPGFPYCEKHKRIAYTKAG